MLDTDGVVKGWAVQRAARHLVTLPDTDVCLGGGGDLVCWTADADGEPWQIGIEHPHDPGSPRGAGAGPPRRRRHVGDGPPWASTSSTPGPGGRLVGVASVTVVAPDLVGADIDATAAYAQGPGALAWLRSRPDRGGLVVWADGRTEAV